ncbi:unnamed protein product [Phaedon cochleariae]|uniref:Major facilitator superfamily (MFS) profile domain-containing protein n=1 Tax=Phaedon cochleariae TaxID=80249 RepID=A0A9P0DR27_PHACE|nr:unnamed protein product [Phaedon cochleariae]
MADEKKRRERFTLLTVLSVNLMTAVSGMAFAWSSPSVPKLQGHSGREFNPLARPATIQEISWITSLHNLGALCGPLVTGYVASKLGKKRTLLLFSLPQLIGNVILIFAREVVHFYAARFLLGMGTGCVFSIVPGFVAEVSDPANRGRASIILSLNIIASQLFLYVVGPYVTIGSLAMVSLVPSVLFLLLFGWFVPETPGYYVQRNKLQEAEQALLKSGRQLEELKGVIESVQESKLEVSWGEALKSLEVKRSLVISLGLMFFQQMNGHGCIGSYMQTIFDSTKTSWAGYKMVMIVGAVQLFVTLVITNIADKVARKKLLGLSYLGQLAAMIILGGYFYLQASNFDLANFFWLPVASVLVLLGSFKIGCGPISWTVASEVFPPSVKYYMNSLVAFQMTICGFLANLMFPLAVERFGMSWTVWGFSGVNGLAILFVVFVVPETKGKSLEEIQVMLREGRHR